MQLKRFTQFLTPDALEYTDAILADLSSKKKEKVLQNPYLFCTTYKSMIASKYEKKIHIITPRIPCSLEQGGIGA
jgi:hypothetical protein